MGTHYDIQLNRSLTQGLKWFFNPRLTKGRMATYHSFFQPAAKRMILLKFQV